jgi:hypothetical protein
MRLLLFVPDIVVADLPFLGKLTDTDGSFNDRECGVIHYIGTRGKTQKTFDNPAEVNFSKSELQRVKVHVGMLAIADYSDLGENQLLRNNTATTNNKHKAVGRKSASGVWILGDANRHPHFTIDLGEGRSVSPTHYSILDGNAGSAFRTWELHGSLDGKIFFMLRKHTNDQRQPANLTKGTWALRKESIKALSQQPQHEKYVKKLTRNGKRMPFVRYFRIVKTAMGTSNSWYLGVAGFEVFGEYQCDVSQVF